MNDPCSFRFGRVILTARCAFKLCEVGAAFSVKDDRALHALAAPLIAAPTAGLAIWASVASNTAVVQLAAFWWQGTELQRLVLVARAGGPMRRCEQAVLQFGSFEQIALMARESGFWRRHGGAGRSPSVPAYLKEIAS